MTDRVLTFTHLDSNTRIAAAAAFAAGAHAAVGQRRKYTGEAYINHPANVVQILCENGYIKNKTILAAAYLHDVVEDTKVTLDVIRSNFGDRVAYLVEALTDPMLKGNRAVRKQAAREKIAAADGDAQTIKVADLIDNSRSIVQHDPNFAKIYMCEKRLLLEVMTKADAKLAAGAWSIIRAYEADHHTGDRHT